MVDTSELRRLPTDLVAILLSTPVAILLLLSLSFDSIRYAIGLFVLLFPLGYAIVSALFPENSAALSIRYSSVDNAGVILQHDLDTVERLSLSCGASIIGVSILGLAIEFSPLPFRPDVVLLTLGAAILAATAVAARRRLQTPVDERFTPPNPDLGATIYREFSDPNTSVDAVFNLLVICSLVFAMVGSVFVLTTTGDDGGGSEFYVLTGDGDDRRADGYPRTSSANESVTLDLVVENNAESAGEYTVVALLQRVSGGSVERSLELDRFTQRVGADADWELRHSFRPELTGDRVRVQYLLYRGSVPDSPRVANAAKELHLWVNVSAEPSPTPPTPDGTPPTSPIGTPSTSPTPTADNDTGFPLEAHGRR